MAINRTVLFSAVCVFALVLSGEEAQARNVSYVGGWTVMEEYHDDSASVLVHYTPHRKLSLGHRYEYFPEGQWHYNALQVNYLAKRWNNPESQANLYLLSGLGIAHSQKDHSGTDPTAFSGIATDWEDRRYFISYENRYLYAGDKSEFFTQKARVGVAPYVAESGALHTWLMVEAQYQENRDEDLTVTPLIRMFKGPALWETGWTIGGGPLVNMRVLF